MNLHPKIIRSIALGCAGATVWVLLAAGLFQLFHFFDWEWGKLRALLLLALALVAFGPLLLARRVQFQISPPRWFQRLALILIAVLVLEHVRSTYLSIRRDWRSEMGEIHFHAVKLLNRGVNPYGTSIVMDPVAYGTALEFPVVQRCVAAGTEEARKRFQRFWSSLEPADMEGAIPQMPSGPECAEARRWMSMAGLKYGPVMLLSYYPLVLLFDRPGIYLTHLGFLLVLCFLLLDRQRLRHPRPSPNLLAVVPLAILLGSTLLRFLTLKHSDSDLIPTLFGVAGLFLVERGHPRAGATMVGLSVGAKLFPGLLYLPLLLGAPKRVWLWALGTVALAFAPFLAWDAAGFVNNIFVFNFIRPGDSTAWANDLSGAAQTLLLAGYVTALALFIWRTRRRGWLDLERLAYLVIAHIGLFLSVKMFHNNYLLWLMPLYGLWISDALALFGGSPASSSAPRRARAADQP